METKITRTIDNLKSDNVLQSNLEIPRGAAERLYFAGGALFTWSHNHRLINIRYEQVNRTLMGDDSFVYHQTTVIGGMWDESKRQFVSIMNVLLCEIYLCESNMSYI